MYNDPLMDQLVRAKQKHRKDEQLNKDLRAEIRQLKDTLKFQRQKNEYGLAMFYLLFINKFEAR